MNGLASIISELERQKAAIDKALSALRDIGGVIEPGTRSPASVTAEPTGRKRKYKVSAEARERMRQGQQRRYAHLHKTPEPEPVTTKKHAISPEGRKKLALAMKRRWAVKRAAAKKTTAKGA